MYDYFPVGGEEVKPMSYRNHTLYRKRALCRYMNIVYVIILYEYNVIILLYKEYIRVLSLFIHILIYYNINQSHNTSIHAYVFYFIINNKRIHL